MLSQCVPYFPLLKPHTNPVSLEMMTEMGGQAPS